MSETFVIKTVAQAMGIMTISINDTVIDDQLLDPSDATYSCLNRVATIEDIDYEISRGRIGDVAQARADIAHLVSMDDELVFSNLDTGEFIGQSKQPEQFNAICRKLLEQNAALV